MDIPKATHETMVGHVKGIPFPIIIDDNTQNQKRYGEIFHDDDAETSLSATQMYGHDQNDEPIPVGISITLKIKTPNDYMEFIIIPDNEFVSELITSKKIHFGNSNGKLFFHMDIDPKPIENVWENS